MNDNSSSPIEMKTNIGTVRGLQTQSLNFVMVMDQITRILAFERITNLN